MVEPAHAATVPEATSDEEDEKPIPLHPKQKDYKMIKHWTPDVYNGLRHRKGGTPRPDDTNAEDPLSSIFWEDQFGRIIPPKKRKVVTGDLRAFWQQKYNDGEKVVPFLGTGLKLRDEYRSLFEERYPWLRLCEDHWKVDRIWINHFSGWSPVKVPEPVSTKRERSDENEPGPSSKKAKSTAPEEPVLGPKPRPVPRQRKPAAKVTLPFLRIYTNTKTI